MSTPEAYGRPSVGAATATAAPATSGHLTVGATTATGSRPAVRPGGPRKVRLTLAKVDSWSVMKIGFLLSVAIGISLVVLVAVLWMILSSMGVFADINRTVGTVIGSSSGTKFNLMDYVGFGRVISLATVIAVIDVFLLTALATLASFAYNMCAQLVGGMQMTLTDD